MAVKPGDSILKHLTAAWYNRVDQATLPQRKTGGTVVLDQFDHLEIKVRNTSNIYLDKYTPVVLDEPYFNYQKPFDVTHTEIVFNVKNSEDEVTDVNNWAVLQEPLLGGVGKTAQALMLGITWIARPIVQISGDDSLKYLQIDPDDVYDLVYSSTGKARILYKTDVFTGTTTDTYFLVVLGNEAGGGGEIAYAFPPTGGIPPSNWDVNNQTLLPGQSICELAVVTEVGYVQSGDTVLVQNPVSWTVGKSGRPIVIGKLDSSRWVVLVEDCGEEFDPPGGGPNPEPPVNEQDMTTDSPSSPENVGISIGI